MDETQKKTKITKLEIDIELEDLDEKQDWPKLAAYVFNRSGTFLTKKAIGAAAEKHDIARIKLDLEGEHEQLIVKVAPDVEDLNDLARYQPVTSRVTAKPGVLASSYFKLPKVLWICHLKLPYYVTGTVEKNGKPICIGNVDIFDVDPIICIRRLPDPIIERIRHGIIDILRSPPPVELKEIPAWHDDDDDWCGTVPHKFPIPPKDEYILKRLESLMPEWGFSKERFLDLPQAKARMNAVLQKMDLGERQSLLNRDAVDGVKFHQVLNSNTAQFRELLINNFQAFQFYICWYPWIYWIWWPHCWYSLEHLGTAQLQPDGSFSKKVMLSICRSDKPDLWFRVTQTIDGFERVIYRRRPVPCNTYWNHPSGQPVSLHVTDPNAVACSSPATSMGDIFVEPLGIGSGMYGDKWYQIAQAHIKAGETPASDRGLYKNHPTDPNIGTDPYGMSLYFRMDFHAGLRGIGVHYYRWSFRKAGSTDDWAHIKEPIIHIYHEKFGADWRTFNEYLGPKDVTSGAKTEKDLFKVRDPEKLWSADQDVYAIWNTAEWDSDEEKYVPASKPIKLQNGLYELKLEMFDQDGIRITNPTAKGFKYMLETGPAPSMPDDELKVEDDGSIILGLYLDNEYTVADIKSVAPVGSTSDIPECQFIENMKDSDKLAVKYVAYHPNGFMDHYDLVVVRGILGTVVESKAVSITPWDDKVPALEPLGVTQEFRVDHLLRNVNGHGPFDKCAFAVWLHVYPRTRNGRERIRAYEAHDTSAFALIKATNP
jgi:hypothetical protein